MPAPANPDGTRNAILGLVEQYATQYHATQSARENRGQEIGRRKCHEVFAQIDALLIEGLGVTSPTSAPNY